ncbi:MAG: hypothetical protein AAF847_11265 [Bacteroidota bacterium]
MKLIVNCKDCRNKIKLKKSVNDRVELARAIGDEFKLKCEECLKENKYHVNDVKAKESKLIAVFAFVIFIFGTGIIVYLLRDYLLMPNNPYNVLAIGGVILIPLFIYMILTKQDRDNARRFNQYWT